MIELNTKKKNYLLNSPFSLNLLILFYNINFLRKLNPKSKVKFIPEANRKVIFNHFQIISIIIKSLIEFIN